MTINDVISKAFEREYVRSVRRCDIHRHKSRTDRQSHHRYFYGTIDALSQSHSNAPTDFARLEIDRRTSESDRRNIWYCSDIVPYSIVGQQRYLLELIIQTLIRHCIDWFDRYRRSLLPALSDSTSNRSKVILYRLSSLMDCRELFHSNLRNLLSRRHDK